MRIANHFRVFTYAMVLVTASFAFADATLQSDDVNVGGIRVKWTYTPDATAGNEGIGALDVYVRDAVSSAPVSYGQGQVLGWLQHDRQALSDRELTCEQRVKSFLSQGVGQKSDIDLNTYRIVTLNSDGTVAFINPFVGFNNAKLEAIIDLKERPADWLILPKRMEAWILLADTQKLVSVDLQTHKISQKIEIKSGSGVRRIFKGPAGRIILPMLSAGKVGIFDPQTNEINSIDAQGLVDVLPIEGDEHTSIFGVALFPGNVISLIQNGRLSQKRTLAEMPTSATFGSQANKLILTGASGAIVFIENSDATSLALAPGLSLKHGVVAAKLLDNGRSLFALGQGRATVIDLARRRETFSAALSQHAGQIVETGQFVYAIDPVAGRATLFAKDDLKHSRNQSLDVMLSSPGAMPSDVAGPVRVVASADGNGVLTASATDGMIYQYSEGMMAPGGSYSNYRRAAIGVTIVDYALREVEPGHYRSVVRPEVGGRFDLVLAAVAPKFNVCGSLSLTGQHLAKVERPHYEVTLAGEASTKSLRVRVSSKDANGESQLVSGLADLTLLIFDKHSGWQRRTPMRELSDGEYEARFSVPFAARYALLAQSASANLSYLEGRIGELTLGGQP